MGVIGKMLSFGAGYAVGAKVGLDPLKKVQARVMPNGFAPASATSAVDVRRVSEAMTAAPLTLPLDASVTSAAGLMAENDVGDVIVTNRETQTVAGIVTDRDIAIRVVAEGRDPSAITVGDIFSRDLVAASPTDTVQEALELMRGLLVRRLPVVDGDVAVGVISLGDLSRESDAGPTLAGISAGPPDH